MSKKKVTLEIEEKTIKELKMACYVGQRLAEIMVYLKKEGYNSEQVKCFINDALDTAYDILKKEKKNGN